MRTNPNGRTASAARRRTRALVFSSTVLFLAAAAALLSGCTTQDDDRTAGVDEFPNSIYARVNGFLDEGKKAEAIQPAAPQGDTLFIKPGVSLGAGKVAAAKFAAAGQGAAASPARRLAMAATGLGCVTGTITITDSVRDDGKDAWKRDTLSVCLDAFAFDSITGNETLLHGKSVTTYADGRVETADVSDGDGDGILNPKDAGSREILILTSSDRGVSEKTSLVVGPGPDLLFATEADNLLYAASWAKLGGTDTLGSAVYTDADSDGVAVDNGKPSVVDLDFYQKGPSADHPDAVWSRAQLRLVVRYQVEAKEARRVRFEMEDTLGRNQVGEVLDAQGGIYFRMGDTVQARFLTVASAPSDTLDSSEVRLTMGLGADFDSKADDSVYAMEVRTVKKLGEEKAARFSFRSDRPIPSGMDPVSGTFSMEAQYADATSIAVDGTLSAARMDVIFKDRAGKRLHVVWDRQGKGISLDEVK